MKRILPATEFVHSVIRSADDTRFHEVRRSRCLCPPPSFIFVRRNFQFLDNIVPGIVDARRRVKASPFTAFEINIQSGEI